MQMRMRSGLVPNTAVTLILVLVGASCTTTRSAKWPDFPDHVAPSSPDAVNALFNDANNDGKFGLWIYRASGSCPMLRTDAPVPLVAGVFKLQEGSYPAKELRYCYILPAEPVKQEFDRCTAGNLTLVSVDPHGRVIGSFDFAFESGKRREGRFSAIQCGANTSRGE